MLRCAALALAAAALTATAALALTAPAARAQSDDVTLGEILPAERPTLWMPDNVGPGVERRFSAQITSLDAPTNFRVLHAPLVNGVYEARARSFDLAWDLPSDATGLNVYVYELVEGSTCPNQTDCRKFKIVQYTDLRETTVPVTPPSEGTYVYEIEATAGTVTSETAELTVKVPDRDSLPTVTASFGASSYSAVEGESVTVAVRLNRDPQRQVTLVLATDNRGGATNDDHSGIPSSVTFESGETQKTFDVEVTQDSVDDDLESVRIIFYRRAALVTFGSPNETVVSLLDDDGLPAPTATPRPSTGGGGGFGFGAVASVAPKFRDGFRTEREVAENTEAGGTVGKRIGAFHPDNLGFSYSLGGGDSALFAIDEATGQIMVGEGTELDYESGVTSYSFNVFATDTNGNAGLIIVTVRVTDVDLGPYDVNGNEIIERAEVLAAVSDYFAGRIQKAQVLELVSLYFAS